VSLFADIDVMGQRGAFRLHVRHPGKAYLVRVLHEGGLLRSASFRRRRSIHPSIRCSADHDSAEHEILVSLTCFSTPPYRSQRLPSPDSQPTKSRGGPRVSSIWSRGAACSWRSSQIPGGDNAADHSQAASTRLRSGLWSSFGGVDPQLQQTYSHSQSLVLAADLLRSFLVCVPCWFGEHEKLAEPMLQGRLCRGQKEPKAWVRFRP